MRKIIVLTIMTVFGFNTIAQDIDKSSGDKILKKLKEIKVCAKKMWSNYSTTDALKKREIGSIIDAISFAKFTKITIDANSNLGFSISYLDSTSMSVFAVIVATERELLVISRNDSAFAKNVVMSKNNSPQSTKEGKLLIFASLDNIKKFDVQQLALTLIHEIDHIYQQWYMIKESEWEPDAWNLEVEVLKSNMDVAKLKEFNIHVTQQKKEVFDRKKFESDNKNWLQKMFGQSEGYLDLFYFNCYGFNGFMKDSYENVRSLTK